YMQTGRFAARVLVVATSVWLAVAAAAAAQTPTARHLEFPKGSSSGLTGAFWTDALGLKGSGGKRERLIVVAADGQILETVDGSEDAVLLSPAMAEAL